MARSIAQPGFARTTLQSEALNEKAVDNDLVGGCKGREQADPEFGHVGSDASTVSTRRRFKVLR